jgi:hypothetical protein
MFVLPRRVSLLTSIGLALVGVVGIWFSARSVAGATGTYPVSSTTTNSATTTGASLHNPTLDNHDWYEFGGTKGRYQASYFDGSWLPDDDDNTDDNKPEGILQDWRLWFLDGTAIVESDPEEVYAHHGEGVQMRPYEWGKGFNQLAGLYQVVYSTTPCLVYHFQMHGQSRPEDDHRDAALKVGIDRGGWHPDSKNDPAVHGDFPSTTVWGPSHDYKFAYAPLTVTAEALSTTIVVYTYGDAPGGRYHRVLWDTGSFQDVTPASIYDPENPSTPSGISNLQVITSSDSATVTWTTANEALGQVYYRVGPTEPVSPTGTLSFTVYLPLTAGEPTPWHATLLNKTPATEHTVTLTDLVSGRSYDLIVASRGVSNEQCVTWVSEERTFKTSQ